MGPPETVSLSRQACTHRAAPRALPRPRAVWGAGAPGAQAAEVRVPSLASSGRAHASQTRAQTRFVKLTTSLGSGRKRPIPTELFVFPESRAAGGRRMVLPARCSARAPGEAPPARTLGRRSAAAAPGARNRRSAHPPRGRDCAGRGPAARVLGKPARGVCSPPLRRVRRHRERSPHTLSALRSRHGRHRGPETPLAPARRAARSRSGLTCDCPEVGPCHGGETACAGGPTAAK